jgi:hypothetical protein
MVDATVRVLTELGPMTEEQLVAALTDRGADPDEADVSMDDVLDSGGDLLVLLADDRWAALPALLEGRVFTHRVTGPELEHDILAVNPDLGPVVGLFDREARRWRLIDGAQVSHVLARFDSDALTERGIPLELVDGYGALLFPPGYLRELGCREGDVLTLRGGQAGLRCEVVDQSFGPVTALGERLAAVMARDPSRPVLLDTVIFTACADDPELFTEPLPPLAEAVDACGFPREGEWLAPQGFDFGRWRVAATARRYGLDDDEALVVLGLSVLYRQMSQQADTAEPGHDDGGDTVLSVAVPFLANPVIAKAVLTETIGFGREGAEGLALFADTLESVAPRSARPGLLWLRGKAYERCGDIVRAEADYEAAYTIDSEWPPVLTDLARYASDRGDADRAVALLRRAGNPPTDPLVELLSVFRDVPRSGIGRNDPCWCGSGRKYKKCHINNERLPIDERAVWLFSKMVTFVTDGPWNVVMLEAAQLRAKCSDEPRWYLDAMADPIVGDVVLFEGGGLAEFVATRGGLLPDDERLLAEQWLLAERSVYEVEHVGFGVSLTLRDVRTGDSHKIRSKTVGRTLRGGELVCARLLPVGDTMLCFGGIEPVASRYRDELIKLLDSRPDHLRLIEFLTQPFTTAETSNSEGEATPTSPSVDLSHQAAD